MVEAFGVVVALVLLIGTLVASLGAPVVIDRSRQDFTRTSMRFDAVFDSVGQTTLARCRHLLEPGAPYLTTDLGPGWQNLGLIPWTRVVGDHRVLLPFPTDERRYVQSRRKLGTVVVTVP